MMVVFKSEEQTKGGPEASWIFWSYHTLIARKSALEKTQLSDVLITNNLF